jgi:subtilisin family serine protease
LPGRRWLIDLPVAEAERAMAELSGDPEVGNVSETRAVFAADLVPTNPCYDASCGPTTPVVVENPDLGPGYTILHLDGQSDMWAIHAAQAWAITKGSPGIVVAVLDTGVNPNQAQLVGKVIVGPNECIDTWATCASPYDNDGHGTFVTGLIAAQPDDGTGIAGLGWNTRVLDIKVLNDEGQGKTVDEDNGIYAAVSMGARVINLSLTSPACSVEPGNCGPDPDEEAAVEYALSHGVVVVAAAGNSELGQGPSTEPLYPASYPGVLSVAAATDQGVVNPINGGDYQDFSEYGDAANIAAPGIEVLSTWYDGNYAVQSGTSEAAPHVAAAAALVMAADPSLSGPQVATLLRQTAVPLTPGGTSIDGGFLDVGAAVAAAAAHKVPSTLDGYALVGADGSVYSSGVAAYEGSMSHRHLAAPIVGAAEDPDGLGYWLAASDGGVFSFHFGPGRYYGSAARLRLREPISGIVATPDGRGYWLVDQDGSVFNFGDARKFKPLVAYHLSFPIVGMAATSDGRGYWLVASDGAVYAFGDARRYGSARGISLRQPIVGMAATLDGHGYWLVAKDGGVFAFGDAGYYGSETGKKLAQPIVGIAAAPSGSGYWLANTVGHVYDFGSPPLYEVPAASSAPSSPVVAIAS